MQTETLKFSENLDLYTNAVAAGLKDGDRVRLSLGGQPTDDAFVVSVHSDLLIVRMGGVLHHLQWGDVRLLQKITIA